MQSGDQHIRSHSTFDKRCHCGKHTLSSVSRADLSTWDWHLARLCSWPSTTMAPLDDMPPEFKCPLSYTIMTDPVRLGVIDALHWRSVHPRHNQTGQSHQLQTTRKTDTCRWSWWRQGSRFRGAPLKTGLQGTAQHTDIQYAPVASILGCCLYSTRIANLHPASW